MERFNTGRLPMITITVSLETGAKVHVAFTDTGPGIADTDKKHIFEPFFSLKSRNRGLGLAIVRDIIKKHDGEVDETGVEGEGARFVVRLPTMKSQE